METLLDWVAPACIILGALLTASNLGNRITGFGFIALAAGSLAWMGIGLIGGPPSLVWQNIVLALLNAFGIWRWLGRQAGVEKGAKTAQQRSERLPQENLFPASLLGRAEILAADGSSLGTAVDAMIGCGSGRVCYLVVSQGGVAGVGETLRRLDWRRVEADGGKFSAHVRRSDDLQELQRDEWPGR